MRDVPGLPERTGWYFREAKNMYITENEIMSQHEALLRTCSYMLEKKDEIISFFKAHDAHNFVFLGCGSSYMLAKSGQRLMQQYPGTGAAAVAGGDFLVNPAPYEQLMKNSVLVVLSRSGKTTEVVRDVKLIKERYETPVISISMLDHNDVMPFSDLDLTLDWCYDRSVCQTRTVTNLYTALLLLAAFYGGDEELCADTLRAAQQNEAYKLKYRPELAKIAQLDWEDALVLADGPVEGIAEEGALAFTEIAMLPGKYFHMLDFRHGPMVLLSKKTLTVVLVQPEGRDLQRTMVEELKEKGGVIVTISEEEGDPYGADLHITLPDPGRYETWGIYFIFALQMGAYEKAMVRGTNPDAPTGLDAYITLK